MSPIAPPSPPASRNRNWAEEATERAVRAFAAGSAYFLAIALASAAYDPARTMLVERGAPAALAILLEAAVILAALAVVAAAAIRLFGVRDRAGDRLLVGSIAATLMLAAELVGGPWVRGWGLYETLTSLMPEPSALFLGLLVGMVLTPLLEPLGRTRRTSRRSD